MPLHIRDLLAARTNDALPAAYNKWHETELERWLSDNNIPYPTPADRRDLEKLIEKNWNDYAVTPYNSWDTNQLSAWLKTKGVESKDSADQTKDSLVSQVKSSWYESEDKAQQAWINSKDWILDSWTESSLKAFCDKNGIPGTLTCALLSAFAPKLTPSSSPAPQA